jgi:hypothetical protein
MIHHLHSTLPSETNASATRPSSNAAASKSTSDSFHGALSDAVKPASRESIGRGATGSENPVPTTTNSPSSSATSSGSSSAGSSASASSPPPADSLLDSLFGGSSNAAPAVSTPQLSTESKTAPVDAQQSFDDAYWAAQPPAVQALRTIQDPDQRAELATELANDGYTIDVPIMVWGWDPSLITSARQADGYTWVPSALQNPVEVAPGLPAVGSVAAYNPNNPPSGSIAV